VDEVLLVAAWFRKHPKELKKTKAIEVPAGQELTA
jgi:hypothetical protein